MVLPKIKVQKLKHVYLRVVLGQVSVDQSIPTFKNWKQPSPNRSNSVLEDELGLGYNQET